MNATVKATILREIQDLAYHFSVIGIDEGQFVIEKIIKNN